MLKRNIRFEKYMEVRVINKTGRDNVNQPLTASRVLINSASSMSIFFCEDFDISNILFIDTCRKLYEAVLF